MQLKRPTPGVQPVMTSNVSPSMKLGASLAAAACSLLGTTPTRAAEATEPSWVVDSALFYYGENEGRVKDASARIAVAHDITEDRKINLGLTVDVLTGASPSGATKTDSVQTYTRPSGDGSYQVAANALPLDDTFHDLRLAANGSYTTAIGSHSRLQGGLDVSTEYDYFHAGINGRWEQDLNQKNTTVFAGLAFGNDSIKPVGGVPLAYGNMQSAGTGTQRMGSSDNKTVIDGLIGVTQIINRRSLIDVVLSLSKASGYLSDPYKVLTVVDASTGRPVSGITSNLYEKRPDQRLRKSLFAEYRYALDRDSWAVNYRFMSDDWGITSHTVEARYHWNLGKKLGKQSSLEPQLRYYTQNAADFYRTVLVSGQALPDFASADYRLADMNTWTIGIKAAWTGSSGRDYSVRAAYYTQTATESAGSRIGVLTGYADLVPATKAVMLQLGVKFGL